MEEEPFVAGEPVLDRRTADLGAARLGPLMVKLSIPGMVGMLVMSLYNIVDTFWVSGLPTGTQAIAALTILMPLTMVAAAVGWGISAGVTSLVSRRFGAARTGDANRAAGNAIFLAAVMGLGFTVAGLFAAGPLVRLLGATPEIVEPSIAYLTITAAGFPFMLVATVLNAIYRGAGNTLTPMLIMAFAAGLNAVLDPLLIYGPGPFPRMEIRGAALATLVAQIGTAVISVAYLRSRRTGYRVRWSDLRPHWPIVADIAQVGAPATADSWLRSLVGALYNWVLAGFGPAAIAAHGLSMRVLMLVISCLGGGVNQALTPIVGFSFGARDYRRMWRAYKIAAVWTSTGGLLLGGAACLFAPQLIRPFADDPGLLELGALALRLRMCTFFLVEPQMMAVFSLQGMGMGGRAMLITMSRNVIFVMPLLLVLPPIFGVRGAFAVSPLADILACFVAVAIMWPVYRAYQPETGAAKEDRGKDAAPERPVACLAPGGACSCQIPASRRSGSRAMRPGD